MTQPQSQPQYMVPRHYIDDPAPNSFRPSPCLGREEDQHTPIFSRHIDFLDDALADGVSLKLRGMTQLGKASGIAADSKPVIDRHK